MRGALVKIPGIEDIMITKGEKPFSVKYDPAKVDTAKMLAALKKSGEPATLAQ